MENVKGPAWGSQRVETQGGFSIIEFLLVLTAFVIFLGAAFIGYRTLKASGNETQIANRFKLFATGLKNYAHDFYNSYPYVKCASPSNWMNGVAPSNNIASCSALEQYIGSLCDSRSKFNSYMDLHWVYWNTRKYYWFCYYQYRRCCIGNPRLLHIHNCSYRQRLCSVYT